MVSEPPRLTVRFFVLKVAFTSMTRISAPSAGADGSVTANALPLVSVWYSVVAVRVAVEARVYVENPPGVTQVRTLDPSVLNNCPEAPSALGNVQTSFAAILSGALKPT